MRFWHRRSELTDASNGTETDSAKFAPYEVAEIHEQTARALARSRRGLLGRLGSVFEKRDFGDELWEEIEEILIGADAGLPTAETVVENLRARAKAEGIKQASLVRELLREELVAILVAPSARTPAWEERAEGDPLVLLVVGINGAGKTTSIAKLAAALTSDGATVMLAAADTFRAAAIEQLKEWGTRTGVRVVAHQDGADPGAVVFDTLEAAEKAGTDVVIVDTAGRLHTKANLMEELKKISRIVERKFENGPRETLLVLDATTGQNGIAQARTFTETVGVTGIILAKLDGTAKGGVAFAISHDLRIPVRFIGTGEHLEDLSVFDAEAFVDSVLGD